MSSINKIAVLLTCHNRKKKTLRCLRSLSVASSESDIELNVFLVDDGCTDGTADAVKEEFPSVYIIKAGGDLFWAGGMRLAWKSALDFGNFDAFLLLNDDVSLFPGFLSLFEECYKYSVDKYGEGGVYTASTIDKERNEISYGGRIVKKNNWRVLSEIVRPNGKPQEVDLVNANILWVDRSVVDKIGILSECFTHGIADFDYGLRAKKAYVPVLLASKLGGNCKNDHGKNYLKQNSTLRKRVSYLKSPTGLAYREYLHYIYRHFPLSLPYSFFMLWLKTLSPIIWEKFK